MNQKYVYLCVFICTYIHVYIYVYSSIHIKIFKGPPRPRPPSTTVSGLYLPKRGPVLTPADKLQQWEVAWEVASPITSPRPWAPTTLSIRPLYMFVKIHTRNLCIRIYMYSHPQNTTQRILPHPIEPPQLLPWSLYPKYPLRTSETTSKHARLTNICICIHVLRVYICTCISLRYINTYI